MGSNNPISSKMPVVIISILKHFITDYEIFIYFVYFFTKYIVISSIFLNLPKQKQIIDFIMEKLLSLMAVAPAMATDDYVGFTFFVGCMAMMAASAFFFYL